MFKKAGTILLTSLLILSMVGFVVSRHYCNNILVSLAVDTPADKCGDGMTDTMNNGCCHDVNEYVVLKTDFIQPPVEQLNIAVVDILDFELASLLEGPSTENTNSRPFLQVFLKPGKSKSLALIQSYLL